MTMRLLAPVLLAAGLACAGAAPAHAVEYCDTISPTFIDKWTVCVRADAGPDGATVGVYCDLTPNSCQNVVVTVP